MISSLGPAWLIRGVCAVTIALTCAFIAIDGGAAAGALWQRRALIIAIVNGLFLILTVRPVFRVIHRVTFAKYWWFPWIDGKWQVEIRSNWPTVERMMNAAQGEGGRFNILMDQVADRVVCGTATIKSGLVDVQIVLRLDEDRKSSRTIFVRPAWCKPSLPTLHYIYEQIDVGTPAITDQRSHLGAAFLVYDPDLDTLSGEYWTQRQASKGLNTAGTVRMSRASQQRGL